MSVINKESIHFVNWILQQRRFQAGVYSPYFKSDGLKLLKIFDGFDIKERVEINNVNEDVSLIFENSKFEEIVIDKSTFDRVSFIDCTINKLSISETNLKSLRLSSKKDHEELRKINSLSLRKTMIEGKYEIKTVIGQLVISDHSYPHRVSIEAVINRLIVIENQLTPSIEIKSFIQNCEVLKDKFPFQGPIYIGDLRLRSVNVGYISGCVNNLELIQCAKTDITFEDFRVLNNIRIHNHVDRNKPKEISFVDCYVGGKLEIDDCNADLRFLKLFEHLQYLNYNIIVIKSHLGSIKFEGNRLEDKFIINELRFDEVYIDPGKELKLSNINCWNLVFDDFRCTSTGSINDLSHGRWIKSIETMDELITQYRLKTSDKFEPIQTIIKSSTPSISLVKSNLGKMELMNVDLSRFELLFHSSKLVDIYITGSELPTIVKSILPTKDKKARFRQQKIAYTQLKKINEQQGDLVNANIYFANEMNAHFQYLELRKEPFEVFNLWLNGISSNHGQSIKQAFWTTIIVSIACFTLFCYFLGFGVAWSLSDSSILNFWHLIAYFPEFMNPVHRLESFNDLVPSKTFPPSARFVDGVSRIVLAYFLYQFIQAFRKHGKSK